MSSFNIHVSQGKVATRLRCGGIFNDRFIAKISCWVWRWKNSENQLIFGEAMDKSIVSCFFWLTVYNSAMCCACVKAVGRILVEAGDLSTAKKSHWRAVSLTVWASMKTQSCRSSMKTGHLSACTVDKRTNHRLRRSLVPRIILLSSLLPSTVGWK